MLSRKLIKKQPHRGLLTYAAALSLLALTVGMTGSALAVHDESMQLDGDVLASTTTSVGGTTQTIDWDSLFDADGNELALPSGFQASDFSPDFKTNANGSFNTSDDTTFATGSKDILPISGWQCNHDNNVNSKIDISNAYSAAYKNADGDDILYFALERAYNGGDANVGFWFLQSAVGCSSPGGSVTFTGDHTDGDLLIVSAFTKGGVVSTIDVYRWNGGANGSLNTTPSAHGADCKTTGGGDTACATVNTGTISTPWLTNSSKLGVGHSLPISSFFEGGLNLTQANLSGKCFNSFFGDTRSSQSLTATLFDFAGGTIGECITDVSSAQNWLPNDDASVSVTGSQTWTGTVAFTLYDSIDCTGASVYSETGIAVSNSDPDASTSNTATSNPTFTADATHSYSWLVTFTPSAASAATGVKAGSHCESTDLTITN